MNNVKPLFLPDISKYQVVYDCNKQRLFKTNAQKPREILFCADTFDDPKNKDNYFGLTKLSKSKQSIVKEVLENVIKYNPLTAGVAIKKQLNEITGKNDIDLFFEAGRGFTASTIDFGSALYRFFKQNIDIAKTYSAETLDRISNIGNVLSGGESFSSDINERYKYFYKQIEKNNNILKNKIENFLQYSGIAKTDKDGFVYDLAGGGASLLYALAFTAITKSPTATAEFFGAYQYQSLYEEGIERGFSPMKARNIGFGGGVAEAVLETVGLHLLIENFKARGSFGKILKSVLTEGLQEAGQQGFEEFIAKISHLRDTTIKQIRDNIFYAGVIGGILGCGSAGISNFSIEKLVIVLLVS